MHSQRTVRRPRHYLPRQLLVLLRPVFRYSHSRDAYILRGVGASWGPVLRVERRRWGQGSTPFRGAERRRAGMA